MTWVHAATSQLFLLLSWKRGYALGSYSCRDQQAIDKRGDMNISEDLRQFARRPRSGEVDLDVLHSQQTSQQWKGEKVAVWFVEQLGQ